MSGEWAGRRVCVAGIGVSGAAAARALLGLGARVTAVDGGDDAVRQRTADELRSAGARVLLGEAGRLPDDADAVVTSPGWPPHAPVLATAAERGIPVLGEVELAWRLRGPGAAPWLAVTGTNGKTTVVRMLAAMLGRADLHTDAVGNVGTPLVEAVRADPPYDVLAVELSSFQLHWSSSVAPLAAAIVNLAPDHVDWHGTFAAYAADKAKIWAPATRVVFNADDSEVTALAGGRPGAVSCTLGEPSAGQLGVVDGMLVDRAFATEEALASVADVRPAAPHNVANALAAAALARAYGVPAAAVRDGLAAFRPDPHRMTSVLRARGVHFVDDSKGTNPHAVAAALSAYERVVWIAGGLLKGAAVDDLVTEHAHRLRGAVLLGRDRGVIADALRRHAPDVPVVEVAATDTGAMDLVVEQAARLARPGEVVLLSPAGASWDMFENYPARGDAFAAAAKRWASERSEAGA
ncbi:MAG: UDP-N-acetylmuramoyl-L-alanine--D-glutamate ligase [Streptosporangiales bacterium]